MKKLLSLLTLFCLPVSGGLTLTDGGPTYLNCGQSASINSLTTFTYIAWIKKTGTTTNASFALQKGDISTVGESHYISVNRDGGANPNKASYNVSLTSAGSISSPASANFSSGGGWQFFAGSYNDGTKVGVLYQGSLSALVTQTATSTGSGSMVADGTTPLYIGAATSSGSILNTGAWGGQVAWAAVYNTVLTLAQLQSIQYSRKALPGLVFQINAGFGGTGTQPDESGNGNNCTVTGATVGPHVPLPPVW